MTRRLAGAALALVVVGGASQSMAKPPIHAAAHAGGGVTTLEPSGGEGWRPSDDPGDPFTAVGVIGGRSVNAEVDPDGTLGIVPPDPAVEGPVQRTKPGTPPTPAKSGANWLPEPPTWALFLIGLAMIGFAIRGLVAARRRLTNLEENDP